MGWAPGEGGASHNPFLARVALGKLSLQVPQLRPGLVSVPQAVPPPEKPPEGAFRRPCCRTGMSTRGQRDNQAAGPPLQPGFCSLTLATPRLDWILRVSGPCYIGQKSQRLRSTVYHLFRNHGAVPTPEPGLVPEAGVASRLPGCFLRPAWALGSRHLGNINCPPPNVGEQL